jgi:hypothetical protein
VASYDPAGLPPDQDGHGPAHAEARAELRDRETYYAELRFAVHCENRSVPAPRSAPDGESLDEMIARFGDTWT